MNVILLEKIGKLGGVGDTASVKSGYARNYLFPFGKAIPATKRNLADFEGRKAELLSAHNEKMSAAQARAGKLLDMSITIPANASEEGKLFGSVGARSITDAINAKGGDVSKSEVRLPRGALHEIGEYGIIIDLGYEVEATVTLSIVPS